jgi:hypothetical protein
MDNWPFKYVNGVQTPESVALEAKPAEKPLKPYNVEGRYARALLETNEEEALL